VLAANPAFCQLIGIAENSVIGRFAVELGIWENMAHRSSTLERLVPGQPFTLPEQWIRSEDGRACPYTVRIYPSMFEQQPCWVTLYFDLSPEHLARKVLADSRRIIDAALSSISDGVCIIRSDEAVLQFNRAFVQMHGLPEVASRIASLADLRREFELLTLDGKAVPDHDRPFAIAQRSGSSPVQACFRIVLHRTGQVAHYRYNFSPIIDENGINLGCIALVRDIGEEILNEERLHSERSERERLISTRTDELANATRAAESANRAKTAFLTNISHEIRTPLHAIATVASLLKQNRPPCIEPAVLDSLQTATHHLTGLIDSVLDLSRIEAGRLELDERPFNLRQLIDNVIAMTRDEAQKQGLELDAVCDAQDGTLIGDAQRLQQALLNYVGNAIKHTRHGRVGIRVSDAQNSGHRRLLRFEVSDTGDGIPESALPRLFSPFEQIEVAGHAPRRGSGLGLVITRRLARLMGGDAGVQSEWGIGSTFWFTAWVRSAQRLSTRQPSTLPQPLDEPRDTLDLTTSAGARPEASPGQPRGRLLLVDDDPIGRSMLSLLLTRRGYAVDTACDGVEAVERSAAVDYSLILMDMQMPRMDGPQAAITIRAQRTMDTAPPIIALTANGFEHDRQRCTDAGMCDFISKPVSSDVLFDRLDRWLKRTVDHA
jgi:signal transduction histidine kinase/CheY-like chemotaxis protein